MAVHKDLKSMLEDTALAIREKLNISTLILVDDYPAKIRSIPVEGDPLEKEVTASTSIINVGPDPGMNLINVKINPTPSETKSVNPSESALTVTPSSGKYLSSVSVGAISTTYVGSEIPRRNSGSLSASGATVTVPAGYYSSLASKAIASGSATTPTKSINVNPSMSRSGNRVTASYSGSATFAPTVSAGYISSGTNGTVSTSGSSYYDIPVLSKPATIGGGTARTVTPDSGYLLSSVTVAANYSPTEYSKYGTDRYNAGYGAGKSDYNPTYSGLDNAGNLTIYNSGWTVRYTNTFSNNYNSGYSAGNTAGYNSGYSDGYNAGISGRHIASFSGTTSDRKIFDRANESSCWLYYAAISASLVGFNPKVIVATFGTSSRAEPYFTSVWMNVPDTKYYFNQWGHLYRTSSACSTGGEWYDVYSAGGIWYIPGAEDESHYYNITFYESF